MSPRPRGLLAIGLMGSAAFALCLAWVATKGLGVLGNNNQVPWGLEVVNFTWWLGIAQAGTLISAGLLLFHRPWRSEVSRAAESMSLAALACALVYGALHGGIPWNGPGALALWSYAVVALLFWYLGLLPQLAARRDRDASRVSKVLALGWRGSGRHWAQWKQAYALVAALCVPLAIGAQSVASLDFAASRLPGWHSTSTPLLFTAAALLSGLALLALLLAATNRRAIDGLNQLVLVLSLVLAWAHAVEHFTTWFSGAPRPQFSAALALACSAPQLFWFPKARTSTTATFAVCALTTVGVWLDRYAFVLAPQQRGLPAPAYAPTWVDVCLYVGSLMFFLTAAQLMRREVKA